MKKLFISCPMKGRTEENIRKSMDKMHKIAEIIYDQQLEVIHTYIEDNPPADKKQAVWYLGKSILLLSEADYYIGVRWPEMFHGCEVENEVARLYNIECTLIDMPDLMPDVKEMYKVLYPEPKEAL